MWMIYDRSTLTKLSSKYSLIDMPPGFHKNNIFSALFLHPYLHIGGKIIIIFSFYTPLSLDDHFAKVKKQSHLYNLAFRLRWMALKFFIRPSSDGTYYGMAMSVLPSVRPSVRPSGSPSVSHSFPHFSPTCFDISSWNFECHFLLMRL